jgi:hypothetical protein
MEYNMYHIKKEILEIISQFFDETLLKSNNTLEPFMTTQRIIDENGKIFKISIDSRPNEDAIYIIIRKRKP